MITVENKEQLKQLLVTENLKTVKVDRYTKEADGKSLLTKEIYDVTFSLDWNYKKLLEESRDILKSFTRDNRLTTAKRLNESKRLKEETTSDEVKEVVDELLESLNSRLASFNSTDYEESKDDEVIKIAHGVEQKKDYIYFNGIEKEKTMILEGTYKKVNSKDKTIIKEFINKQLPMNKLKRYKVAIGDLHQVSLE